ncbi:hypothetical protein PLESTB_001747000 [Pleodorina starrii]|uniref:Fungal lipase-type domain-containing protein n=1 Tax=Pleodorina starrii TaxID=330485 RepID=A0A9W6C1E8_9CHLO|nr:hypothetical protein PLESTM_001672300 [Pleodorina starrii]GLC61356.1 hypothetical protein PLESTB_001747000 [Pleodorina starrii]GLC69332.1 hypothetical protein PLESTF_000817800 [Pleodorina starrii]
MILALFIVGLFMSIVHRAYSWLVEHGPEPWRQVLGIVGDYARSLFPGLFGLSSFVLSLAWILKWPSLTEVVQTMVITPTAFMPTRLAVVINDALQWALKQVFHTIKGSNFSQWLGIEPYLGPFNGAIITNWLPLLQGLPERPEHHRSFPTKEPGSNINAEVLAYCALASYEDYDNLRKRVSHWNRPPGTTAAAAAGAADGGAAAGAGGGGGGGPSWQWIKAWNFEHVKHDDYVDTGVFLLRVANEGRPPALVLTFRGTEALSGTDWMSDFIGVIPPSEDGGAAWKYGFFHQGFKHCLGLDEHLQPITAQFELTEWGPTTPAIIPRTSKACSPFSVLMSSIADELGKLGEGAHFYVTGHSLGGALTNLFSAAVLLPPVDKANDPQRAAVRDALNRGAIYTWGQPRVGGPLYTELLNSATAVAGDGAIGVRPRYFRIVNTNDIITRIPPAVDSGFQHSGTLLLIEKDYLNPGLVPKLNAMQPPARQAYVKNRQQREKMQLPPPVKNVLEQPPIFYLKSLQDNATKLACAIFPAFRRTGSLPPWLSFLNILTRASALFAGLPMMLGLGLTFLMVAAQAGAITFGLYFFSGAVIVDALLLLAIGVVFWPVAASGMVDHSMRDYYAAALYSYDSDWNQPRARR